jgi:hypothetical protein
MRCFTVEIQASNRTGEIWQAVAPAETVDTAADDNAVYDNDDGAVELARDVYNNQTLADDHVRVLVWNGAAADTSTEPDAVYDGAGI